MVGELAGKWLSCGESDIECCGGIYTYCLSCDAFFKSLASS